MTYTPVDIKPLSIEELTTTTLDGTGVLDVLLRTLDTHLAYQYDRGRIDGVQYAQIYAELYASNLSASITYSVERQKLGYVLANLQAEGQLILLNGQKSEAEIEGIKADTEQTKYITANQLPVQVANLGKEGELLGKRVSIAELEITEKIPAEILQTKAATALTQTQRDNIVEEMTLIPHRLSLLQGQLAQSTAETALTAKNTERVQAEIGKIPVEIEILRKQSLREDANIQLVNKQVEEITLQLTKIPKDILLTEAQTANQLASKEQTAATTERILKETTLRLPIEITNLTKQGDAITADIALTQARTEDAVASLAKIPAEIDYMQAQSANMGKQTLILEKNLELKAGELDIQAQQITLGLEEIALKREQLAIAKEQVKINEAQSALYMAKVVTEQAQTKGGIAETGSVIDYNNQVLQGQITGYKNDALQKSTKIYLDAWMVGAQAEIREANNINKLDDPSFGKVVMAMLDGVDITL